MAGSLTQNPLLPPQLNELLKGPNKAAATEPKITWELEEQMAPPPHLIPAHPSPPSTHLQGHRGRQALEQLTGQEEAREASARAAHGALLIMPRWTSLLSDLQECARSKAALLMKTHPLPADGVTHGGSSVWDVGIRHTVLRLQRLKSSGGERSYIW